MDYFPRLALAARCAPTYGLYERRELSCVVGVLCGPHIIRPPRFRYYGTESDVGKLHVFPCFRSRRELLRGSVFFALCTACTLKFCDAVPSRRWWCFLAFWFLPRSIRV